MNEGILDESLKTLLYNVLKLYDFHQTRVDKHTLELNNS